MSQTQNVTSVLIVSDRSEIISAFQARFAASPTEIHVHVCMSPSEALNSAETHVYALVVVCDTVLADGSKQFWSSFREKSLAHSRVPMIWVGQKVRDPAFLQEVEQKKITMIPYEEGTHLSAKQVEESIRQIFSFLRYSEDRSYQSVSLESGALLFGQDDVADAVYILVSGRLEVYRNESDQSMTQLGYIEAGEFVGEMSYLNRTLRNANVKALESCRLVRIPIAQFEAALVSKPSWSHKLLRIVAKRLDKLMIVGSGKKTGSNSSAA